ncbi:hypothetical protein ACTS95_08075 [Empedobacter brevis]
MTKEHQDKMINSLPLIAVVKEGLKLMNDDSKASAYELTCGHLVDDQNGELQVRIYITRDLSDFNGDLENVKHQIIDLCKK